MTEACPKRVWKRCLQTKFSFVSNDMSSDGSIRPLDVSCIVIMPQNCMNIINE